MSNKNKRNKPIVTNNEVIGNDLANEENASKSIEEAIASVENETNADLQNSEEELNMGIEALPSAVNTRAKKIKEAKEKVERVAKEYSLAKGSVERANKNPASQFAFLVKAIHTIRKETIEAVRAENPEIQPELCKVTATREAIVAKAYDLGMPTSKMTSQVLFSWYKPDLMQAGWIVEPKTALIEE